MAPGRVTQRDVSESQLRSYLLHATKPLAAGLGQAQGTGNLKGVLGKKKAVLKWDTSWKTQIKMFSKKDGNTYYIFFLCPN